MSRIAQFSNIYFTLIIIFIPTRFNADFIFHFNKVSMVNARVELREIEIASKKLNFPTNFHSSRKYRNLASIRKLNCV